MSCSQPGGRQHPDSSQEEEREACESPEKGPGHAPPGCRLPFALWCQLYILLPVKVTEHSSLVPRASLRAQWITCNARDLGLIPGLGRSSGEGKGCPLQYSDLESSVDCIVRGVAELDTTEQLSLALLCHAVKCALTGTLAWGPETGSGGEAKRRELAAGSRTKEWATGTP